MPKITELAESAIAETLVWNRPIQARPNRTPNTTGMQINMIGLTFLKYQPSKIIISIKASKEQRTESLCILTELVTAITGEPRKSILTLLFSATTESLIFSNPLTSCLLRLVSLPPYAEVRDIIVLAVSPVYKHSLINVLPLSIP